MSIRASRRRDRSGQQDKIPELSCEACNERKVRCDKQNPCSTCQATGVVCVPIQRKRLPRGRHVKENKELRDRLARLESLIGSDHPSPASTSTSKSSAATNTSPFSGIPSRIGPDESLAATASSRIQPPTSLSPPRYLANGFWNDLADKDPRLDGVLLEQSSGSKLNPQQHPNLLQQRAPGSVLGLGFSSHSQNPQSYIDAALALRPAPAVCEKLCQVYLERVDPIVRVLHRPSLMDFLLHGKPYLDYHDTDPVLDVLRSAVFFLAIVSLPEERCQSMFDTDRTSFIATYRLACEVALDRAQLVTTGDVTVVQSFVLYLIAVRSYDRSRTAWTLFPITVRLAIALGLNRESSHTSETFFQQQMRRRLWYTICVLDVHSSFDRGSEPIIGHRSMHPRLPFNIDDSEFGPGSRDSLLDKEGLTDMTKALIQYDAQATGKALGLQEDNAPSSSQSISKIASSRRQLVHQFELHTRKLVKSCDPNSSPYAWITWNGALTAIANMQLSLRRPMNQSGRRGISTDTDPTNLLRLATTVLERDIIMRSDLRGEPFRWYGIVHWHPLAVAVAECYVCDNIAILRHVWPIIETSFEHIGEVLAEYRQGTLWKPLERLMQKTRSHVHAVFENVNFPTHTQKGYSSACMGPSENHITPIFFPSSSTSIAFPPTTTPMPYDLTSGSSTIPQIAEMSSRSNPENRATNSQADASCQQTTPPTPFQTTTMTSAQNAGDLNMDFEADASFWSQMTESMSDDAGWDAWDEFINNFDGDWNDDVTVV